MALHFTAAKSSRITKPKPKPPTGLSPSKIRKKAAGPRRSNGDDADDQDALDELFESRLDDIGPVRSFAERVKLRDVTHCLAYIADSMFDDIPEQRSGMNSTRQVETRLYRRGLPPLATVTHVHALSRSPTSSEREAARLIIGGAVRKLSIPGRGLGSTSIGEFFVLTERWIAAVEESSQLNADLKTKYVEVLRQNPTSTSVPGTHFSPSESSTLLRAGFLTTSTAFTRSLPDSFTAPDGATKGTLSSLASAGARNASGTVSAIGGSNAIHDAGGRVTGTAARVSQVFNLSLPNVGVYLKLLSSAREHLVMLLSRSQFKEAPVNLLRERWDGGVAAIGAKARPKGLAAPVLPGRTRKWKQFHGLRFQWVLEECLGTGMVECFDTGSVGLGVRLPR